MDIRHRSLSLLLALAASGQSPHLPLTVDPGGQGHAGGGYHTDLTLRLEGLVGDTVEIVRLVRSPGPAGWQAGDRQWRVLVDRAAVIHAPAGTETLLVISAPGRSGYLLEGPFRWPAHPSTRAVSPVWRRTVRGTAPESAGTLTWVGAADMASDGWPHCAWLAGGAWECLGVPLTVPGVVLTGGSGQFHAFAPGAQTTGGVEIAQAREAAWGRLIVVGLTDRVPLTHDSAVTASSRRVVVPRQRPRSLRLDAGKDDRVDVQKLGPHAFWVGGSEAPAGTWVEIAAAGRAPARIDVTELEAAPPGLPVFVGLEPAAQIEGRVTGDAGTPVSGALLTLWRVLPAAPGAPDDAKPPPRRLFVAETTSDADGRFGFTGLGADDHEIVALHPARGRGEVRVAAGQPEADVRLRPPSVATGEVLRNGQAAAGVPVRIVPNLEDVAAGRDLTRSYGGESRTGADGRFRLAVPEGVRSEVRIGDGDAIRRVSLGPGDTLPPVIDLGRIDLDGAAIVVRLVLESAEGCALGLSGPLGGSGLSLVPSQRIGPSMFEAAVPEPGQWLVSATCDRRLRLVHPASIHVQGREPVIVPLVWK